MANWVNISDAKPKYTGKLFVDVLAHDGEREYLAQ